MSKSALLLYPNQLFAVEDLPKDVDRVIMVEEPLLFGTDQQHKFYMNKQKLAFYRATMQRYMKEELWPAGYQVDYVEFHQINESGDIVEKLKDFEHVSVFEIDDDILSRRLVTAINAFPEPLNVSTLQSPNFYLSTQESEKFFANKSKSKFSDFYQWQRERFNILIDPETYKPVEGKWDFEIKKRKRLPKNHKLPSFQVFGSNDFAAEAIQYVTKNFPDNPGSLKDFPWPTNRAEATAWLQEFLKGRLDHYDVYKDALDPDAPWGYHSGISPLLNSGLLKPKDVIEATVEYSHNNKIDIENTETFVRQILGWREYARGVYRKRHIALRTSNNYQHTRRMTPDWYNGTTGIPPVDDIINKVQTRGYAHHNERLMVIGNIMFLCEFHPDDIHRWFIEMFVDTYDWNVVPVIYGISQGASNSIADSKPSISTSNYILSMSHYEKGVWSDIWDGLYWRAIEKYSEGFARNPNMKMTLKQFEKLDKNRLRVIGYRAEDFLKTKTFAE